jgi:hypothetical protein
LTFTRVLGALLMLVAALLLLLAVGNLATRLVVAGSPVWPQQHAQLALVVDKAYKRYTFCPTCIACHASSTCLIQCTEALTMAYKLKKEQSRTISHIAGSHNVESPVWCMHECTKRLAYCNTILLLLLLLLLLLPLLVSATVTCSSLQQVQPVALQLIKPRSIAAAAAAHPWQPLKHCACSLQETPAAVVAAMVVAAGQPTAG